MRESVNRLATLWYWFYARLCVLKADIVGDRPEVGFGPLEKWKWLAREIAREIAGEIAGKLGKTQRWLNAERFVVSIPYTSGYKRTTHT